MSANDHSQFLALNQTHCERVFSCFNGKSPFNKTMVMTIPKIFVLIGCYISCLLLDLKYKKFKSVFWLMQNEEIVNMENVSVIQVV